MAANVLIVVMHTPTRISLWSNNQTSTNTYTHMVGQSAVTIMHTRSFDQAVDQHGRRRGSRHNGNRGGDRKK